jgi:hypothetical protein
MVKMIGLSRSANWLRVALCRAVAVDQVVELAVAGPSRRRSVLGVGGSRRRGRRRGDDVELGIEDVDAVHHAVEAGHGEGAVAFVLADGFVVPAISW